MALISIPTSISGVSIPGGALTGPLGALFSNPFNQNNLQYPRDLQSATKGHVIHFTIKETKPILYEQFSNLQVPTTDTLKSAWEKAKGAVGSASEAVQSFDLNNAIADVTEAAYKGLDSLTNAAKNLPGTKIGLNSTGLNFQPKREKIPANIFLYMPDTMNFQYDVSYDDSISALGAAGKFVEKFFKKEKGNALTSIISSGVSSGAASLLGQKAGYAVNPQLQMLFQGIGFRSYQMAFTFTPYSRDEAKQVETITKLFRTHAAPKITTGSGGMFFIPPSSFNLKFLFNGAENKHMHRLTDCVITNIDLNYSPNGWAAYDDGVPVQTTLVLQFKEIELVDRTKIEKQGY